MSHALALLLCCCLASPPPDRAGTGTPAEPRPPEAVDPLKLAASVGAAGTITVKDAPELSGPFWENDTLCVPPAAAVTLQMPGLTAFAFSGGEADKGAAPAWNLAGGTARKKAAGSLDLFTPQVPETAYTLELRVAGRADPLPVRLCVLHEAEIKRAARDGTWSVSVGRLFTAVYPNPEVSDSWRVRLHKDKFSPPRFWMRITPANQGARLAPHVTVGMMVGFITEADRTRPKRRHTDWFPPNRQLVLKMELLSRALKEQRLAFTELVVNSGFRTPAYNRRIGGATFSRHIYGDAVDVIVDENGDEVCDDLTRDGRVDENDGLLLGQALRKLESAAWVTPGGIGVYGVTGKDSCLSFVHLDARGYITRWGSAYQRGRRVLFDWWPASEYREDEEPPAEFRHLKSGKGASQE
jgi:hypothetical protein